MPQVIKRVLPAVTNEMITLVKDTSLAFVLTVTEMFTIAKQIAAAQASVMPLMAAGVFYYIFNLVVAVVMEHVEKKCKLLPRIMQDARETVRGAKLYFCSQTEIQERYKVTMSQIYLEMNHIKKTFGELEVLKDISLSVHKGEVVSVIGPSGSGKSTLLRCATMLEKMDGGELSFLGEKAAWEENGKCVYANKKQLKEIRKNFGLVFQNFNLFPHYTVMKNIIDAPVCVDGVSKEEAKERAWKLLKQLGLSDKADAYPYQLSGGQQQRVSIARALCPAAKGFIF